MLYVDAMERKAKRICNRFSDFTISRLLKFKFRLLVFFCDCTNRYGLDLVRNPDCLFSLTKVNCILVRVQCERKDEKEKSKQASKKSCRKLTHENTSMQYTENFLVVKTKNFTGKNVDIFLIFAQNIDCGYTLEPPR